MNIGKSIRVVAVSALGFTLLVLPAAAQQPTKIDLSSETVGAQPRALYGERYAEFLDRVQAYAYYPYTVAKDIENFRGGEIAVRFEGLSGRIDQGAGILFNLKPNGDYLTLRANCLENNLVLWKFEKGKR